MDPFVIMVIIQLIIQELVTAETRFGGGAILKKRKQNSLKKLKLRSKNKKNRKKNSKKEKT